MAKGGQGDEGAIRRYRLYRGQSGKNSEGPDEFYVVIRRKQGRDFMLWSLELPEASDRDYQRFIAAEPDLTLLRDLTAFRYENRLD